MDYCFESVVNFFRRVFTSTTFNELIYRLLAACFIAFGVSGLAFVQPFLPIILLIFLVTLAETIERWLAIPHVTIVSLVTLFLWLPFSIWDESLHSRITLIVSQNTILLVSIYIFPLLIAAYTGALTTLSDIWKVQLDVSILIAFLPTVVEVIIYSLILLAAKIPFSWCILTALCVCAWDHRLIQRRATLMEKYGVGLRNDLPQLMRSSLVLNLVIAMIALTFGANFVSPCYTNFKQNASHVWNAVESNCIHAYITSSDSIPSLNRFGPYFASLAATTVLSGFLFLFGRHTGAPKTQMLSSVVISSLAVLFQAFIPKYTSSSKELNKLHWLHGCEPLACFMAAAGVVYGWKKNYTPQANLLDSALTKVKHARNNIKILLYAFNIALHAYLAAVILTFCLSIDQRFLEPISKFIDDALIVYPKEYLLEFREKKNLVLIISAVASVVASMAKIATVVGILKWKYHTSFTAAFYVGSCTIAKGTMLGVLACYILMVRVSRPFVVEFVTEDHSMIRVHSGQQLSYAVDIIIATVMGNVVCNPLCALISALLSKNWKHKRRTIVSDVELNSNHYDQ